MKTSQKGIDLIKGFEGLVSKAYLCPAGVWTIGYGHTKAVKQGMVISELQADYFLKEDLTVFENYLNSIGLGTKLNQNQFDALISWTFNVGTTAVNNSTLLKLVCANPNNESIRNEFAKWVYSKGKKLPGLVRRREAEANLYFEK